MDLTNDGYVFVGWNVNDTTYDDGTVFTLSDNTTINMIWTPFIGDLTLDLSYATTAEYSMCLLLCSENNFDVTKAKELGFFKSVTNRNVKFNLKNCDYSQPLSIKIYSFSDENPSDLTKPNSNAEGSLKIAGYETKGCVRPVSITDKK